MGTRADLYVGRGPEAEWLGSIAMDGYPDGIEPRVLHATTENGYRASVREFIAGQSHGTTPEQGWPWPWENSRTTDYAYAFDDGAVWGSCFGGAWFKASEPQPETDDDDAPTVAVFPDMTTRQCVTYGPRSGLIVIGPRGLERLP